MRTFRRLFATVAVLVSAVTIAHPANATPQPQPDEWWFSAWGIQRYVWPRTTGSGVTVAVLDTGVNASLPELNGVVLKGGDTADRKSDGRQDLDDHDGGHGTGMAALIAGQGGGTTGYVGIAPGAKILPVHVTSDLGDKYGSFEAIADGIRFAVDHDAKVINISLGITSTMLDDHCDPGVQKAIAYAVRHDVVVVASAGNSGTTSNWPELPASCAGVLAVGAIERTLRPWQASQRQPYVAVAAPGADTGTIGKRGQYYPQSRGTSIAAALTSGAVALIRSLNPHMPARTVVQRLIATAKPIGSGKWNDQTGYGAIQITSAMDPKRYSVPASAPNPVYDAFDRWQKAQNALSRGIPSPPGTSRSRRTGAAAGPWSALPVVTGAVIGIFVIVVVGIGVVRRRSRGADAAGEGSPDLTGPFRDG